MNAEKAEATSKATGLTSNEARQLPAVQLPVARFTNSPYFSRRLSYFSAMDRTGRIRLCAFTVEPCSCGNPSHSDP